MLTSPEVVLQFVINWLALRLKTDNLPVDRENLNQLASLFGYEIPSGQHQSLEHQHFVTEVIAVYNNLAGASLQQSQFVFILRIAINQLTQEQITTLTMR